MQLKVISDENDVPEHSYIAVDTCLFIDAFHNPECFQDFFKYLEEKNIILTTTFLNYLEFSKGFDTIKGFNDSQTFLENIVKIIYPLRDLEESAEKLKLAYRTAGQKLQIPDLFLGSMGLKWPDKMLILTKNHSDFISELFDIECFVPFCGKKNSVQVYSFYRFSTEKYVKRLKDLSRTIK